MKAVLAVLAVAACGLLAPTFSGAADDGAVLPFPPVPSASKAAPRLQDSVQKRRAQPDHLKPGAPNILIVLIDDVGFGQATTFGGEINTPTLSLMADEVISDNTVAVSPDWLAVIQVATRSRMARSSSVMRPPFRVLVGQLTAGARAG